MLAFAVKTSDNLRDAIKMVRGLAAHPEKVATVQLRGSDEVVVIERGVRSREGDLVAVRLMPERRVALGRVVRENGHVRVQPVNPRGAVRDISPGAAQMLGRVLSVIRPS